MKLSKKVNIEKQKETADNNDDGCGNDCNDDKCNGNDNINDNTNDNESTKNKATKVKKKDTHQGKKKEGC